MYYSNSFPSSYEELITYYPMFYRDVLEMRAILEADGRLLDGAVESIERLLDNCFVDTADEATITMLEKFLRIESDTQTDLEERRRTVKLYFTGFGKISASKLKEALYPFTETESTITFRPADEARNNLLKIVLPRGKTKQLSELEIMRLLAKRIPAHLWYGVELQYSEGGGLYFGVATTLLSERSFFSENEDVSAIDCLLDEAGGLLTDELGALLTV